MVNMAATLIDAPPVGFSKTARPRPRHREAVGDGLGVDARAVRGRRLADDGMEGAAEGPEAPEADVEADVGDAAVGLAQQEHRALDPAALEVAVGRLAERRAEGPDEVRLGDAGDPGQRGDVERLVVAAIHRVARAEQPAVPLLDGPAHGPASGLGPAFAPATHALTFCSNRSSGTAPCRRTSS